jgi:hypothetical protein
MDTHCHLNPTGIAECSLSKMQNREGCRNQLGNVGWEHAVMSGMMAEKKQIGKRNTDMKF